METVKPEVLQVSDDHSAEIKDGTLDFFLNSILAAREKTRQAMAEYNQVLAGGQNVLLTIDPESVSDPDLRDNLIEVHLIYRGQGGA